MKKPARSVEAYGNRWERATPGNARDVRAVERVIEMKLPEDLRDLLLTCGGGHPAKDYFASDDSEVAGLGIGYVLPLRDEARKTGVAGTCRVYRAHQNLPLDLIPFALDAGHANLICVRLPKRDIVYWLHDDPDEPIRYVAPSLDALLNGLGERPY